MRLSILTISLTLLMIATVSAQLETEWVKMYGSEQWAICNSVEQTSDSGFILAGFTESLVSGLSNFYLVKTDSEGDAVWSRTFGGAEDDECVSVYQTRDGGYIIGGCTESYGAGGSDIYLAKTDAKGNILWERTFGGNEDDICHSMIITADNCYVLTGCTESFGAGEADMYLLKVDAAGNLIWERTFGDGTWDECCTVRQLADGGYILGGSTGCSRIWEPSEIYLVQTDPQGNMTKDYRINLSSSSDCCNSILPVDDGYVLAGCTDVPYYDSREMYLMKIGLSGDPVWVRIYDSGRGSYDKAKNVLQVADGGYILGGYSRIAGTGVCNYTKIIKTNDEGYKQWEYSSKDYHPVGNSVLQTIDGGYAFAGWIENEKSGNYMCLVRLSPEDVSAPELEMVNAE